MKWRTPSFDRALDQRARVDRVVAIIAERIAHRVRHHDRGGEMDDRVDAVLADDSADQRLVAAVADNERHACRRPPSRKPVERLSSTTTRSPASTSSCTMWLPI